jgi:hypothetical protein
VFFVLIIGKLHWHPVGLESTTSPSALLQMEEVPFELKLIVEHVFCYLKSVLFFEKSFVVCVLKSVIGEGHI